MKRERDVQRSRVYKAEDRIYPRRQDRDQFPTLDHVREYVLRACSRKRLQAAYPRARFIAVAPAEYLVLKDGGGTRSASGGWHGYARLNFPLWSRNERVILHELAHVLTDYKGGQVAAHGWQFCETLLVVTLHVQGREQHDRLKAEFVASKVRFRAPRRAPELTPEQRAANIERLRAYREGRAATKPETSETLAFWGLD